MAKSSTSFAKGQSGNPGGRRKVPAEVYVAMGALTMPAVLRLGELIQSGDEKVALGAVKEALERNLGKVLQSVEHAGEGGGAIEVRVVYGKP